MEKIKYIDNKIENGIKIDWKKVIKRCKALGVPENVVTPFDYPFDRAKYFPVVSERSIGKTTNWILLGMVLNDMYGIIIQYIRQIVDMIMPKNSKKLFKTILEYDYIEQITEGRYNSVKYSSRGFYYYNTETKEMAVDEFMHLLSIDEALTYKSVYNAPRGDLIIFDEFISKYTRPDEFIDFEDLVKTIIRDRYSPIVAMLANTIDPYNIYFKEMEIYDEVQTLKAGESRLITTDKGTKIFIHRPIDGKDIIVKEKHNNMFFGFKNKKLASITGAGDWAISSYPHVPRGKKVRIIDNAHYVDFNGHFIKLQVSHIEDVGKTVVVHECKMTLDDIPKDAVIYTTGDIYNKHFRYCFGHTKVDAIIWQLYRMNRFYYVHNMLGEQVAQYVRTAKQLIR